MKKHGTVSKWKRILSACMAAVFIFVLLPAAGEREDSALTLQVTDEGGNPVTGASVSVTRVSDGVSVTVSEEGEGTYVAAEVSDGDECSYSVNKEGFVSASGSITYDAAAHVTAVTLIAEETEEPEPAVLTVDVSGKAADTEGNALEGVAVTLADEENTYTAATGEDGSFTIENVAETGAYTLTAELAGYKSDPIQVEDLSAELEIVMTEKAESTIAFAGVTDDKVTLTYGQTATYAASLSGDDDTREITYSSSDTNVASVDENGAVVTAGVGTTKITASAAENDEYKAAEATYTLTVRKANQAALVWDNAGDAEITWDKTYTNAATGGSGSGTITYASSDTTIAAVDGSGVVTPNKPGKVTITASCAGDSFYNPATVISYTLTITRLAQSISFSAENAEYTILSGEFTEPTLTVANTEHATGKLTYSSSNKEIATVNATTGEVTFTEEKTGSVTITAAKAEDEYYEAAAAVSYTIIVSELPIEDGVELYQLVGEKKNSSGWYTGNVTVTANDGYLVSKTKKDEAWTQSIEIITKDGKNVEESFYVCRISGGRREGVFPKQYVQVNKDSVGPTGSVDLDTSFAQWAYNSFLRYILADSDTVKANLTITSADSLSGMASVQYYVDNTSSEIKDDGTLDTITDWKAYSGTVEIEMKENCVVYAKLTDVAGNVTYVNSGGIMLDGAAPVVTAKAETSANDSNYYNDDVTITVAATENAGSDSGLAEITYSILGDETKLYPKGYNKGGDHEWTGSFTIDANKYNGDNLIVTVTAKDMVGNPGSTSLALNINSTAPKMTYTFSDKPVNTVDGRGYFNAARTATVTITDRDTTFDAAAATTVLEAAIVSIEDAEGNALTADAPYTISGWTPEVTADGQEVTYTATIVFSEDANYTVDESKLVYTNKAGLCNTSVDTGDSKTPYFFTVDTTDPTGTVTIEEKGTWNKLWSDIVETLTFGRWSGSSLKVTASSDDVTSPIYSVEYYKTDSADGMTISDLEKVTQWQQFGEGFDVKADERFTVYLKIQDCAGNTTYISTLGAIADKTAVKKDNIVLTLPESNGYADSEEKAVYGYYTDDVTVGVKVSGAELAGIQRVEYSIESKGVSGQTIESEKDVLLYSFEIEDPTEEQLVYFWEKEDAITVDAEKYNSDEVIVTVTVTDNAGNQSSNAVTLRIDVTVPAIEISYDNNDPYKIVDPRGYYPAARTATVTITERTSVFDADAATKMLKDAITAVDAQGNEVETPYILSGWTTTEGEAANGDDAVHTATIQFNTDANISIAALTYTDYASLTNGLVSTGSSATPYTFTVDMTDPTGTVTVEAPSKWKETWNELIKTLTFGLWSNDTVSVTATSEDETSPIESLEYYRTAKTSALTKDDLEKISSWTTFEAFDVEKDAQFTIYLKIVDNAGNTSYISTNGVIVDETAPDVTKPEVNLSVTTAPHNGYYTSDVAIDLDVMDPLVNASYSGIQRVWYEVTSLGATTQSGDLYNFDVKSPTQAQLLQSWNNSITVDSQKNNSNNVVVTVWALDNAGNTNTATLDLMIDITEPTISVSYDNNDGDTSFGGAYFKAARTATVTITERNFSAGNVSASITNTDGTIPSVAGWSTIQGSAANGDDTKHVATITYNADGDYTFGITFSDDAGLAAGSPDYGSSLAPTEFTVDMTSPVIAVSYDNNEARNENYYKEARTATITITEHNFETSRIVVTQTASDSGATISAPAISGWSTSGDTHTATITFDKDGLFTFDIDYTDMAGNQAADYAGDRFYVDLTNPALSVANIVDKSANNTRGKIGFEITATDTNFDIFTPVLTAVIREDGKYVTKQLEIGQIKEINNGVVYTVDNIDTDGIYRLTCTVVDKAGNEYTEVLLEKADGTTYTEEKTQDETLVEFSVNRNGSTYELDENTMDVVGKYYVQNVPNDVVIVEINADELVSHEVTLNGRTLTENEDYTVKVEGGGNQWYHYTYSIDKSLFEEEGEYRIVVSSKDKAGSDAFNDVKGTELTFVVDRTAPVVVVSGLESNGRYQVDSQLVTLIPTDDGGALNSLIVYLVDKDGNVIEELVNLSGEALIEALENNNGKITFEIGEGLYQNIRIVCTDCAVDEDGNVNTYDESFTNVSVSSSGFMIFWANKPARYGTIGGLAALAAGGLFLLFLAKKKKKEDEEEGAAV